MNDKHLQIFFAMPILEFPDGSRLPSPKDTFRLYWAILLPLTLVVLAAYAIFQVYIEGKHRMEYQEPGTTALSDVEPKEPSEVGLTAARGILNAQRRWPTEKMRKRASSPKDV